MITSENLVVIGTQSKPLFVAMPGGPPSVLKLAPHGIATRPIKSMPIYGPSASYPEHGIFVLWLPDNRAFVTTQMFAPRDGVFIMRAWSSFSLEAYEDRHFQMDAAYLRGLPYKPIMEMMQVAITMLTPAVYHREFRQALQNATMTHPADFCIPYDLNPRTLDTFE